SSESQGPEAGALSMTGQAVLLQKPFSPEQLVETLSLAVGQALTVKPAGPGITGMSLVTPAAPVAKPPSAAARRGQLRVLLVDDSGAARLHVRGVLKDLGFAQFVEAADGAQAVAAAARENFDLIV